MASFNCYVTDAGRALIATAEATAGTINFVSVSTGSGILVLGQAPTGVTALVHPIDSWPIDGSNALTPFQVTVQYTVNSALVSTTYANTEVGLFGRIGTSGALTLIWYGYTTTPDTLTPSGTSNATIDVNQLAIVFTNATSCIATQTPLVAVPPHAITHITGGFDPLPTASSTSDGVTPITPNDVSQVLLGGATAGFGPVPVATAFKQGGMPVTPSNAGKVALGGATASWGGVPLATTGQQGGTLPLNSNQGTTWCGDGSWQPGLRVITQNVTLYVTLGSNDSTALTYLAANFPVINNNSAAPFAELQGALTWLSNYWISPGFQVSILLSAGLWASSASISINHPNASQITISGTLGASKTSTSTSQSGSFITLTGAAGFGTSIPIGSYILYNQQNGIPGVTIGGVWIVTASTATTITFNTSFGAIPSITTATAGTVTPLLTVLQFASGKSGITVVSPTGLLQLSNMALVAASSSGSTTIYGFTCANGTSSLSTVGAYGWIDTNKFSIGVVSTGSGYTNCTSCSANECSTGFETGGFGANMNCYNCWAHCNQTWGFRCEGSFLNTTNCYAMGNAVGFGINNSSYMTFSNIYGYYNSQYGLQLAYKAQAACGGLNAGSFSSNGTFDISLLVLSACIKESTNSISYSTCNVGIRTLSADGCWFSPN